MTRHLQPILITLSLPTSSSPRRSHSRAVSSFVLIDDTPTIEHQQPQLAVSLLCVHLTPFNLIVQQLIDNHTSLNRSWAAAAHRIVFRSKYHHFGIKLCLNNNHNYFHFFSLFDVVAPRPVNLRSERNSRVARNSFNCCIPSTMNFIGIELTIDDYSKRFAQTPTREIFSAGSEVSRQFFASNRPRMSINRPRLV